ncbi:MAG: SAM-dependent methyltransferase [Thiogranum sp.]
MQNAAARAIDWSEQGLLPDTVIRHGIKRLLKKRLAELHSRDCEVLADQKADFIQSMGRSAIAPMSFKANEQHYEVPTEFFLKVLGAQKKYSCCHWSDDSNDLDSAEIEALQMTCEHAGLRDGMQILELGCGWGSLTTWMARHYPNSRITAISNSASQGEHIRQRAQQLGLNNTVVNTCDMNDFVSRDTYDRIVSVEMFEHMRNYQALFGHISNWLKPNGRFFMHIFCHRDTPYAFEEKDETDWMSRHFFSGGMMPSDDLPLHFQHHLTCLRHWRWDGSHYEKTANAWLLNMDQNKPDLWPVLEETYGVASAQQWWMRWRMFFMACAELFGYDNGQQWWVSHYLFEKKVRP